MMYQVCCHTRDFEYINEFIKHHLDLGFDRIIIYDNMSVIPVKYDDKRVIIKEYKGLIGGNFDTYNDCVKNYCNVPGWTAFIDEDEFINTKGLSIQDAMKPFQHYDALGLNWRMFGDKVDEDNKSTSLVEKYRYHIPINDTVSRHIKTFCKNNTVIKFNHPHFPLYKKNKIPRSILGEDITNSPWCNPDFNNIWIDHYHMRGLEDYITRQSRFIEGNPSHSDRTIDQIIAAYNNHNILVTKKRED